MNHTLLIGIIVSALGTALFAWSTASFLKTKTACSALQLIGAGFLVVVGLCHVCEALRLFAWMGWGLKNSPGHYLDLWSCILGLTFVPLGTFLSRR